MKAFGDGRMTDRLSPIHFGPPTIPMPTIITQRIAESCLWSPPNRPGRTLPAALQLSLTGRKWPLSASMTGYVLVGGSFSMAIATCW